MKVVKENNGDATPQAGCVCSVGSAVTRGFTHPSDECRCNCIGFGTATSNANATKASKA